MEITFQPFSPKHKEFSTKVYVRSPDGSREPTSKEVEQLRKKLEAYQRIFSIANSRRFCRWMGHYITIFEERCDIAFTFDYDIKKYSGFGDLYTESVQVVFYRDGRREVKKSGEIRWS